MPSSCSRHSIVSEFIMTSIYYPKEYAVRSNLQYHEFLLIQFIGLIYSCTVHNKLCVRPRYGLYAYYLAHTLLFYMTVYGTRSTLPRQYCLIHGHGSDAVHVAALGGAADDDGGHLISQDGARWLWYGARWAGIVVITTQNDHSSSFLQRER